MQGEDLYHFAALAYLVGAALNRFLVRARLWPVLLCYMLPNAAVFAIIALQFSTGPAALSDKALVLMLAAMICAYFTVSLIEAMRK